jgi:membrane dipeptidase
VPSSRVAISSLVGPVEVLSQEAIELYRDSDVVDLHVDTFLWTRIFGYNLLRRHGRGLFDARFYSQVDLPRLRQGGVGGAIWSITTNPLRRASRRTGVFRENLDRLIATFACSPERVAVCRDVADFRAARAAGRHAAFIGIQGGNALDGDLSLSTFDPSLLVKVTLVHLTASGLGTPSAPSLHADGGLTDRGRELVASLNRHRIFVDLAHINRRGFFDAVAVHDRTQPLLVSHTGIAGVHRHWRNVDDAQLRAIAGTGGVIGVMYHSAFLGGRALGGTAEAIVDHLQHIVDVVGEDHAALGSDWDGAIITPRDMATCLELPLLCELMLRRHWSPERIRKILGGNFLRALGALRS